MANISIIFRGTKGNNFGVIERALKDSEALKDIN
jgi:hypothetical protein